MSYEKLAQVVMIGRHRIPKLMDITCNTYSRVLTIGTLDKHLSLVDTCQVVGEVRLSVSHMAIRICATGRKNRQYQFTIRYETIQYDIYLLQLGFHPVAVVLTLYTKCKNSNIHKEKQNRRRNTQNGKQKIQTINKK